MIKARKILTLFVLPLFLAAGLMVALQNRVEAVQQSPGCYIHLPPGWSQKSCDDLKVVYPDFNPAGDKCYFSWATGFGPTPPVDIACAESPDATAEIILPKDNSPGQTAGGSSQSGSEESNKPSTEFKTGDDMPAGGTGKTCGEGASAVNVSIDIGCRGKGNGIIDLAFAIIRFLSVGVGIVMVASIVVAGIQYTASAGNPQATAKAVERIQNTAIAFAIYLLIFAILNWLIPAGIFQ